MAVQPFGLTKQKIVLQEVYGHQVLILGAFLYLGGRLPPLLFGLIN